MYEFGPVVVKLRRLTVEDVCRLQEEIGFGRYRPLGLWKQHRQAQAG
jgi:hypothetical protein